MSTSGDATFSFRNEDARLSQCVTYRCHTIRLTSDRGASKTRRDEVRTSKPHTLIRFPVFFSHPQSHTRSAHTQITDHASAL